MGVGGEGQGAPTPGGQGSDEEAGELATDPATGSTPPDPTVEEEGPPLAGGDPMAGEAPSG